MFLREHAVGDLQFSAVTTFSGPAGAGGPLRDEIATDIHP